MLIYDLSQTDILRYYRALKLVSEHDSGGKYAMIASVYTGKKHIGDAFNAYPSRRAGETYSQLYRGMGTHAELAALNRFDCINSVIYLAGVNNNSFIITSKPCPRCNNLLRNSSVKAVVYNDKELGLIKVFTKDLGILDIPKYNDPKDKYEIN